jgi:NAD(P)-dependent dehydrogenase (short-subunit alcohol dehydrogenase family)
MSRPGRLAGKVAVVTGAGAGIGRACALRFAAEGASVAVNALHEETAAAVSGEIRRDGGRAIAVPADVSRPAEVTALVERVMDEFGRIDVLHNNAALANGAPVTGTTDEDWERVRAVTLDGAFYAMRAVLPIMIQKGGGAVVNTASSSGQAGARGLGAYGAAKAGLINLSRVAALENARHGIRVNVVCPGSIATSPMLAWAGRFPGGRAAYEAQIPQGRLGRPEDLRAVHVYDYASDYGNRRFRLAEAGPDAPHAEHPVVWPHPETGASVTC